MHEVLLKKGVEILKGFCEVDKIILYGSVDRGNYRSDSDIDLAVICDDLWRELPLDLEGTLPELRQKINEKLSSLENPEGIRFHVLIYWNSDFERGIELSSGRKFPPDRLDRVGSVVYSADSL